MDYAATTIRNTTVVSFSYTDLVITQPTPYDVWMRFGIYTEKPNATLYPSNGLWPSNVCGVYRTYTIHSNGYSTTTRSGIESVKEVYTATETITTLVPRNHHLYFNIVGASHITELNVTYVQAKTSQFTEDRMWLPLPTNILDWLETQEEVIRQYPYIKNCYLGGNGVGQPTVHVPVNALTVTSSLFLDEDEPSTAKSSEDRSTTITMTSFRAATTTITRSSSKASIDESETAPVKTSQPSDAIRIESTATSRPEDKTSDPNAAGTSDAPVTQPETAGHKQTSEIEDGDSINSDVFTESDALNEQPTSTDGNEQAASPVSPTKTADQSSNTGQTAGALEGLISAIQSIVGQQSEVSQDSPSSQDSQRSAAVELTAATSTAVSEDRPAESVMGFAIGTQAASPGGDAVTQGSSTYSTLPSGSGLRVVAHGQTSTMPGAVLPEVTVAQGSDSDNEYIVGDSILTAGGPAITSDGNTISGLPAGSGV